MAYEVMNTAMNREFYPNWVGRILADPPPKGNGEMDVMEEPHKKPNYFGPWPQFDDEGAIIGEEVGSDAWAESYETFTQRTIWDLARGLWEKAKERADEGTAPVIDADYEESLAEIIDALRTIQPNETLEYGHPDESYALWFAKTLREEVSASVEVRKESDGLFHIYVAMSDTVLNNYLKSM